MAGMDGMHVIDRWDGWIDVMDGMENMLLMDGMGCM